jgi:hypothetical protein
MNSRNLATLIENYLEADDSTDASAGASGGASLTDVSTRQKVGQLTQVTDQLRQDTDKLKQEMVTMKNNLQMSALLPLLMNQKLTVQSAVDPGGINLIGLGVQQNETIQFKQADMFSALLPMILVGGLGGDGGGGSDNSTNMLLLALAMSGKF